MIPRAASHRQAARSAGLATPVAARLPARLAVLPLAALAALPLANLAALPLTGQDVFPSRGARLRDSIPGTLVSFELVAVPGGTITLPGPNGLRREQVAPFWIGRAEVTWDEFDVFMLRLDVPPSERAAGTDAVARPSRPYGAPDRGFGHTGHAAISVTFAAAQAYAEWLSARTGHRYRLATDAEWSLAAHLAAGADTPLARARLDALAWHAGNSGSRAHAVATRAADALGLFDLFGNAGEWVTGADGRPVLRGGSFLDPPERVGPDARAHQTPEWNQTDPQFPKSRWWLSDGPFAGFRLVREP